MTGFVVFAHGSRVESANEAVRETAARMAEAGGFAVQPAFLELGTPGLTEAVGMLATRGATRVVVIPYFLTLGLHLHRDLPKLVAEAALPHRNVEISVTLPLDGHPALIEALLDRAAGALKGVRA